MTQSTPKKASSQPASESTSRFCRVCTEAGKSALPLDLTDPLMEKSELDAKALIKPEPINPLPPVINIEVGMKLFCAGFTFADVFADDIEGAAL